MDELEDAKETPEEMASNFTCAMFDTPQAVLKGARHMVCGCCRLGSCNFDILIWFSDLLANSIMKSRQLLRLAVNHVYGSMYEVSLWIML